jgi:hypothetical protein
MIDVAEVILDPDFATTLTIERTTGGHREKSEYVSDKTILTVQGILVNPKNSKEIEQTPQGDRAAGYVDIYVDPNTKIYVTRNREDNHNNISDIIIENHGTDYEIRYRVTNVFNRSQWGFTKAQAVREGAI